jgi:hypothetical protein
MVALTIQDVLLLSWILVRKAKQGFVRFFVASRLRE